VRTLDVAFTRDDIARADLLIVLDILRATSTIVTALASGYRRVLCVDSVQRARRLDKPGRTLAGEQEWVAPEGFALGNSPLEVRRPSGSELVLATTNGSATIVRAASHADTVLIAALLNLDAVIETAAAARLDGHLTDAAQVARAVADGATSAEAVLQRSAGGAALRERGMEDDIAWCARESVVSIAPRVCSTEEHLAVVSS
jgi:2-phosphosulfolactate phosphatase